jgi:hypothetical protein
MPSRASRRRSKGHNLIKERARTSRVIGFIRAPRVVLQSAMATRQARRANLNWNPKPRADECKEA